jgi:hypothetical protein
MQLRLVQSDAKPQVLPATQGEQAGPPQSRADSLPFQIWSLHEEGAQTPLAQDLDAQSALTTHASLASHRAQASPPQSMSVSEPFRSLSEQ